MMEGCRGCMPWIAYPFTCAFLFGSVCFLFWDMSAKGEYGRGLRLGGLVSLSSRMEAGRSRTVAYSIGAGCK
jgi:hypothetical protein